jgi:hypothetical protein
MSLIIDDGTNGNNQTNEYQSLFRLFCYFRLFRHLSSRRQYESPGVLRK